MAASFPNAKKTFSAVVNGVTKLVAALFNSPYDEIEAIETFIGATGGGAQAYSESLTNLLLNYRRGCACEYKGEADLYVRAGEIMIVDASGNRRLRRNTTDTTVTWANIDTGSEATSTRYYVYACADNNATTFTVKISTNATTPTGMTYYRLIGSFYNNASGNISRYGIIDQLYGSKESSIRAMVHFDGRATGTVTPIASYNITSVVRNSAGNWTITWDTDFADENYIVMAQHKCDDSDGRLSLRVYSQAAGNCVITAHDANNSAVDVDFVQIVAIGIQ